MRLYKIFENPKIYNFITRFFSFYNKRLETYLPQLIKTESDDYILDIGCGTGRYADIFSCKYFGIDPSEDYMDYAKKHHQGTFLKMDGADLKFPDNTFDYVVNISVLHHAADDLVEKMIVEMKRVCKNDGQIFIVEPVYARKINFLGNFIFKLDRGKYQRTFKKLWDLLSKHHFTIITSDLGKTFPALDFVRWAVFSYKK